MICFIVSECMQHGDTLPNLTTNILYNTIPVLPKCSFVTSPESDNHKCSKEALQHGNENIQNATLQYILTTQHYKISLMQHLIYTSQQIKRQRMQYCNLCTYNLVISIQETFQNATLQSTVLTIQLQHCSFAYMKLSGMQLYIQYSIYCIYTYIWFVQ